jgi:hypothetical protein
LARCGRRCRDQCDRLIGLVARHRDLLLLVRTPTRGGTRLASTWGQEQRHVFVAASRAVPNAVPCFGYDPDTDVRGSLVLGLARRNFLEQIKKLPSFCGSQGSGNLALELRYHNTVATKISRALFSQSQRVEAAVNPVTSQ